MRGVTGALNAIEAEATQRAIGAIAARFYDGVTEMVPPELVTLTLAAVRFPALIAVARAAAVIPFEGYCEDPHERDATPDEVSDGCELGIAYDACGRCPSCAFAAALAALPAEAAS